LELATADSIETKNSTLQFLIYKFLILNQNFGAVAGEGTARFSQTNYFFILSVCRFSEQENKAAARTHSNSVPLPSKAEHQSLLLCRANAAKAAETRQE